MKQQANNSDNDECRKIRKVCNVRTTHTHEAAERNGMKETEGKCGSNPNAIWKDMLKLQYISVQIISL